MKTRTQVLLFVAGTLLLAGAGLMAWRAQELGEERARAMTWIGRELAEAEQLEQRMTSVTDPDERERIMTRFESTVHNVETEQRNAAQWGDARSSATAIAAGLLGAAAIAIALGVRGRRRARRDGSPAAYRPPTPSGA